MTPAAIITLVRDVVILVALGLLIWLLVTFGRDAVKVTDMKAVQKQLTQNAQLETQWRKEQTDANLKRDADLAQVAATIGAQRTPVIVRNGPARSCPMSANSGAAASPPAATGGVDAGPGGDRGAGDVDVRPRINQFELKYEKALGDCRAALASWPR